MRRVQNVHLKDDYFRSNLLKILLLLQGLGNIGKLSSTKWYQRNTLVTVCQSIPLTKTLKQVTFVINIGKLRQKAQTSKNMANHQLIAVISQNLKDNRNIKQHPIRLCARQKKKP